MSSDAGPDVKKCLEVCQYALDITAGAPLGRNDDLVSMRARQALLQVWVQAKQLQGQPIGKTFGTDDPENCDGQRPETRCIVALEMLWLARNGAYEFKEAPSLAEVRQKTTYCSAMSSCVSL